MVKCAHFNLCACSLFYELGLMNLSCFCFGGPSFFSTRFMSISDRDIVCHLDNGLRNRKALSRKSLLENEQKKWSPIRCFVRWFVVVVVAACTTITTREKKECQSTWYSHKKSQAPTSLYVWVVNISNDIEWKRSVCLWYTVEKKISCFKLEYYIEMMIWDEKGEWERER